MMPSSFVSSENFISTVLLFVKSSCTNENSKTDAARQIYFYAMYALLHVTIPDLNQGRTSELGGASILQGPQGP